VGGKTATDDATVPQQTPEVATPLQPDLTHTSPVIFARRTPEERRRDKLGVQKILECVVAPSQGLVAWCCGAVLVARLAVRPTPGVREWVVELNSVRVAWVAWVLAVGAGSRVAKERANQGENEDGLLRFLGYYGKKNQSLRSGSALYANVFYRSLDEEFYDCASLSLSFPSTHVCQRGVSYRAWPWGSAC
jgi:hypothetical protein